MAGVWGRCGCGSIGIFKGKGEADVGVSGGWGGDGDVGTEGTVGEEAIACGRMVPVFYGLRNGEHRVFDAHVFPVGSVGGGVARAALSENNLIAVHNNL